jgi:hypothetical protein
MSKCESAQIRQCNVMSIYILTWNIGDKRLKIDIIGIGSRDNHKNKTEGIKHINQRWLKVYHRQNSIIKEIMNRYLFWTWISCLICGFEKPNIQEPDCWQTFTSNAVATLLCFSFSLPYISFQHELGVDPSIWTSYKFGY